MSGGGRCRGLCLMRWGWRWVRWGLQVDEVGVEVSMVDKVESKGG